MSLSFGWRRRPPWTPARLTTEPPEPHPWRRPDPEVPLSPALPPDPAPPEPPHHRSRAAR
ncbi:hypothetical protein [Pseudofrankia sp. DC12]|uniref:hypothetical protein n=1 Tax=Pseudofrankia sp. DC12 TaxID=683315 RepID=UPI0005F7D564|nr:hypothetical protein [Pseudofrankia sp. DC12]